MKKNRVKRYRNPSQRFNKWALIFILPFVIGFFAFILYPMVSSIAISFQNDNYTTKFGGKLGEFNAFSNYKLVLTDLDYWHTYLNTLIIFAMNFIPQIVSALFFAALFTSRRIRMKAKGFFQFIYFLPNILTATSVAALFTSLFGYYGEGGGPIYELFVAMGMDPEVHLLSNPWTVRMVIAFIQFWMWFGNSMIIYISGIKGISSEIFEAADLDGASSIQIFFNITLSILKPIMLYSLITSLIGGLQMFDIPYMIKGNALPPRSGTFSNLFTYKTITIYIYEHMREDMDYGIASAASVILFFFSLSLSILMYFLFFKEKNHEKKTWRKISRL